MGLNNIELKCYNIHESRQDKRRLVLLLSQACPTPMGPACELDHGLGECNRSGHFGLLHRLHMVRAAYECEQEWCGRITEPYFSPLLVLR